MELPPGLKPTLVNLDELNTAREEYVSDGNGEIDYRARTIENIKKLWEKDSFDPKSSAGLGTGAATTTQDAIPNNNNIGEGIILVIILIIVIWIIYYVFKRHRKAQAELKNKMETGDEASNYYNKIRSSDLSRNLISGGEIVAYLSFLFAVVYMLGKIVKESKNVIK